MRGAHGSAGRLECGLRVELEASGGIGRLEVGELCRGREVEGRMNLGLKRSGGRCRQKHPEVGEKAKESLGLRP